MEHKLDNHIQVDLEKVNKGLHQPSEKELEAA